MKKPFFRGLQTGLLLQLAIGPVFVFIANTALQKGLINALAAVLGVTVVDYIYIILAILGVGRLLETDRIKKIFAIVSSIVLVVFGLIMIRKGMAFVYSDSTGDLNDSIIRNFASAFALTISSPLTIVFWTSIFTTKSIEYSLTKKELMIFGASAGLSTFIFLGGCISLLSLMKTVVPTLLIQVLNIVVGGVLIVYGISRLFKAFKNSV